MTDQELMMKAAKAAGAHSVLEGREGVMVQWSPNLRGFSRWNPLADDGDALRLAVKLQLTICNEHLTAGVAYCTAGLNWSGPSVDARWPQQQAVVDGDYAATRRAIVLAAADLGRN